MKYQIILRDKNEKQVEISEQEYQEVVKLLNKSKLFRLKSGTIINAVDIKMIEPIVEQQTISKKFRLPEETSRSQKDKELKTMGTKKRWALLKEWKIYLTD